MKQQSTSGFKQRSRSFPLIIFLLFAVTVTVQARTADNITEQTQVVQALSDGNEVLYLSATTAGNIGLSFDDVDILSWSASNGWSMYMDGSDLGLSGSTTQDINAFHVNDDGTILLSFVDSTTIPDVGDIDDSDIIRFLPTSLGSDTAGTFEWFFDGSDVGLTTNGEDIDALTVLDNGELLLSVSGSVSLSGLKDVRDEDILRFIPTSLGANTAGTFDLKFDGSQFGLLDKNEDIAGMWVDSDSGAIYLSTISDFSLDGASGDGADIFSCLPDSLDPRAAVNSCTFDLEWDGSTFGFSGMIIDGLTVHAVPETPASPTSTSTVLPPTATNTPIPTSTSTALPPTATNTPFPTATNTALPPTATNTPFPASTSTALPPTATNTPIPTATNASVPPTSTPIAPTATVVGPAGAVVLFRVNAAGPTVAAIDGGPDWEADTSASPSAYHNGASNVISFPGASLHTSVPSTTPAGIFDTERWDPPDSPEMAWSFPVGSPGDYEVRFYLKNGFDGTSMPGTRIFNIQVEGQTFPHLTDIDLAAEYGHQVGAMKSVIVSSDATLDISLVHKVENPLINAIEILSLSSALPTPTSEPPTATDTPLPTVTSTPLPPTSTPVPTATPNIGFENCVSLTGVNAVVGVPADVTINGSFVPATGDQIAVFSPDGAICTGLATWTGSNIAITVWGDDSQTAALDGMLSGEEMLFRIWDQSTATEFSVSEVGYSKGDGIYLPDSMHIVTSLTLSLP